MVTKSDLLDAIDELEDAPVTYQNCQKLATFYTLLHCLFEDQPTGYSNKAEDLPLITGSDRQSEFIKAIQNKEPLFVLELVDETMEAIKVLQPKLYDSIIRRLL